MYVMIDENELKEREELLVQLHLENEALKKFVLLQENIIQETEQKLKMCKQRLSIVQGLQSIGKIIVSEQVG